MHEQEQLPVRRLAGDLREFVARTRHGEDREAQIADEEGQGDRERGPLQRPRPLQQKCGHGRSRHDEVVRQIPEVQHLGEPQAAVPVAEHRRQLGPEQQFLPHHHGGIEVACHVELIQWRQLQVQQWCKRDWIEQPEEQHESVRRERERRHPPDEPHGGQVQHGDPSA